MNALHAFASCTSVSLVVSLAAVASAREQDFSRLIPLCGGNRTPGIALGDVNKDGRLDVIFGNGRHLPQPNLLYINGSPVDLFFSRRPVNTGVFGSVTWRFSRSRRSTRAVSSQSGHVRHLSPLPRSRICAGEGDMLDAQVRDLLHARAGVIQQLSDEACSAVGLSIEKQAKIAESIWTLMIFATRPARGSWRRAGRSTPSARS